MEGARHRDKLLRALPDIIMYGGSSESLSRHGVRWGWFFRVRDDD